MSCNRVDLATACGQNVARDAVSCCLWGIPKKKSLSTAYIAKPRQNSEAFLKTYDVFIYRQHYIANLFHKNVQKIATL